MKYKYLVFVGLLALTLCGCVAPVYNYFPEQKDISEPPIGSVSTSFVGDTMLMQGKLIEADAIYLSEDIGKGMNGYILTRGYFQKVGGSKEYEFYKPTAEPNSGEVKKAASADPFDVICIGKSSGRVFCIDIFGGKNLTGYRADYERRKQTLTKVNSFQQVLIYSGKIGDKINVGYREFSNDFARPAFNNDVEYDLSESKVIGYKGARIEVIRATNQDIEYRVLKNFNSVPMFEDKSGVRSTTTPL